MRNQFKGKANKVAIAISFDENSNFLIDQAVRLAEKTGMGLHFVHCITPLVNGPWGYYLPNELAVPELSHQAEESALKTADKKLSELVGDIPSAIDVTKKVVLADPTSGLITEASEVSASMILTGTSSYPGKSFFKGASTAIGLVMHSSIPVMVVKKSQEICFNRERSSLLLADDLQESSLAAIEGCGDLVTALGNVDVKQLHIHGGIFDDVSDSISEFLAESWKALNPGNKSPQQVMLEEFEKRSVFLNKRGEEVKAKVGSVHGSYKVKVSTGDVAEEIQLNAEKINADLIIFGRHQFIHKNPFVFGRVPFSSMLMQDRAVMIFPG